MMKRKTATKLGLPVIGRFVAAAVVGVPPNVMGIGPAYAIPKLLSKCGLSVDDVDIYEINEGMTCSPLCQHIIICEQLSQVRPFIA